jgi:putative methyltransferase
MDWHEWHDDYDRPDSTLALRLRVVQEKIRSALDACPPGPLRVISLCAGQGRDLLEVLAAHPRRGDVTARLVELDRRNTDAAEDLARASGLDQIDVVRADAALTDQYLGIVPADIVLVCGLFGNITDEDVERTIDTCTRLCDTGGTVIWTRGRFPPDLIPQICDWFAHRDFDLQWLSEPEAQYGVGVHRFTGEPRPLVPGTRMFTFVGRDVLSRSEQ